MRGCVSTIMNALLVIASSDRTATRRQGGKNGLQTGMMVDISKLHATTKPNPEKVMRSSHLIRGKSCTETLTQGGVSAECTACAQISEQSHIQEGALTAWQISRCRPHKEESWASDRMAQTENRQSWDLHDHKYCVCQKGSSEIDGQNSTDTDSR